MARIYETEETITIACADQLTDQNLDVALSKLHAYFLAKKTSGTHFCLLLDLHNLEYCGMRHIMRAAKFFKDVEEISICLLQRVVIVCKSPLANVLRGVFIHLRTPRRPTIVKTPTQTLTYGPAD